MQKISFKTVIKIVLLLLVAFVLTDLFMDWDANVRAFEEGFKAGK